MERKHHIMISGTGRAGTTFLVELLTDLGLDTGYERENVSKKVNPKARAGLERNIREPNTPYIIKNPNLCECIEQVLERVDIIIDHAFVPIRDLEAAAESRIQVSKAGGSAGGLLGTDDPDKQANVLAVELHRLLVNLVKKQIPITFIHYPKSMRDSQYLFEKLQPVLKEIEYIQFQKSFNKKLKPEWIHKYNDKDI